MGHWLHAKKISSDYQKKQNLLFLGLLYKTRNLPNFINKLLCTYVFLGQGTKWKEFRSNKAQVWIKCHRRWLNSNTKPLHIVRYERLQSHLVDEMRTLMHFLGWNITDNHLQCLVHNSEGNFHRMTQTYVVDPWAGFPRDELEQVLRKIDKWPYSGEI